jgi:hypothetical protein
MIWQANVGRGKEFHASLQKFRGKDSDISEESAEIKVISSQHSFHLSDNVDHKIFTFFLRLYSLIYFIQGYIESIHRLPKAKIQDLFQSKNIYAVTVRFYSLHLLQKTLSVPCKSKKNLEANGAVYCLLGKYDRSSEVIV